MQLGSRALLALGHKSRALRQGGRRSRHRAWEERLQELQLEWRATDPRQCANRKSGPLFVNYPEHCGPDRFLASQLRKGSLYFFWDEVEKLVVVGWLLGPIDRVM